MRGALAIAVVGVLVLSGCSSASEVETAPPAVPDACTAVVVSVLGAPTFPFLGTDGLYHVDYDLELQNTSAVVPATVEEVQVVTPGTPIR